MKSLSLRGPVRSGSESVVAPVLSFFLQKGWLGSVSFLLAGFRGKPKEKTVAILRLEKTHPYV